MTTQSPDQSPTQSPAPSKEMEERIVSLFQQWDLPINPDRLAALSAVVTERDTERCEECNNELSPCGEQNVDGTPSMDCPVCHLRALLSGSRSACDQLKRELSEAREQMDTFINQWSETNNSLQRENLALSASHQRQKEALTTVIASAFPNKRDHPAMYAAWKQVEAALAETPDVSLVDKWKMEQFARGYYCAVSVYLREECAEGCADTLAESLFKQGGGWEHADPEDLEVFRKHNLIPALQPDHQK